MSDTNEVIVYTSQYDKDIQELSYQLSSDIGAWLWIWVPIFLKWYLLIAFTVFVFYEIITGIRGKFNGIKDGLSAGLFWPAFLWHGISPAIDYILNGKNDRCHRRSW